MSLFFVLATEFSIAYYDEALDSILINLGAM